MTSLYSQIVLQLSKTLKNIDLILDKAARHAETRKFDADRFCASRLAPDMFPLAKQIQIACDVAKSAAAGIVGKAAPSFGEEDKSFADMQQRVRKCVAFLESVRIDDVQCTSKTVVPLAYPQGKAMHADEFLVSRALPNFFFHITTAYALLRSDGVDIGKSDFLGQLAMFDV
jgi:hypothetical protein